MHQFDRQATDVFFNETFSKLVAPKLASGLRHRDRILLEKIIEPRRGASPRILDFGCGQGRLLAYLVGSGFDAVGMELHEGMRGSAEAELAAIGKIDRILAGGVPELALLPAHAFDIIIMMGVFQYLSDDEYHQAFEAVARVLRPGGRIAASFQNALFDLFTFNKYTIDFFMHHLVGPLAQAAHRDKIEDGLSGLIVNPDQPEYSPSRARDNVFVRLTNPLLFKEETLKYGFELQSTYFYEWFGLPPLLAAKHPEIAAAIAQQFEVKQASCWQGHFMANAFVAELSKR